ncbi:hypothetical protein POV27_08910 [Aureisphaera galaxeae]|uniref:hypothetical protein n=1 Tax=Aureisphaera galaxeae TaxID=1538023 RepID=UPI002350BBA5|nr:hypothetical protein [Aureisphaera galaxeae]MDC8004168.1 hypothetical protein [Aureisphaera galaxeae]
MNANQISKKGAVRYLSSEQPTNHLRVLSKIQRKQVSVITKDWQRFTHEMHAEMFDKI